MNDESAPIFPLWKPHERRSRGGKRYNVQPLECKRCGMRVAVPLTVWEQHRKQPIVVICEPCSMLLKNDE